MLDRYVCVDLETTSLEPAKNEIIEIGAVKIENGRVIDRYEQLIKPNEKVPPFIWTLTGIKQSDIDNAPKFEACISEFLTFLGDATFVAHNAPFDYKTLNNVLQRTGHDPITNTCIDTRDIALICLPQLPTHKLKYLTEFYSTPLTSEHRALSDAEGLADVLLHLIDETQTLPPILVQELDTQLKNTHPELHSFFMHYHNNTKLVPSYYKEGLITTQYHSQTQTAPFSAPDNIIETSYHKLKEAMPNYEERPSQVALSQFIWNNLNEKQHGVIESETGTGKTCGYLVPAAFWALQQQKPVIISTKTKLLQQQILTKDAETLQKIVPHNLQIAIIKGKENYADIRQFDAILHHYQTHPQTTKHIEFLGLFNWILSTRTGDISELHPTIHQEFALKLKFTPKERGADVPDPACFYHYAKKYAKTANLVITNHALLLTDFVGKKNILPNPSALIIDEAHTIESVATQTFSVSYSKQRITSISQLITDPRTKGLTSILKNILMLFDSSQHSLLHTEIERLHDAMSEIESAHKQFFNTIVPLAGTEQAPYKTQLIINEELILNTKWHHVIESKDALITTLKNMIGLLGTWHKRLENEGEPEILLHTFHIDTCIDSIEHLYQDLDYIFAADSDYISWIELLPQKRGTHIELISAPIQCQDLMAHTLFNNHWSAFMLSATLQVNNSFDFFTERIGLPKAHHPFQTLALSSEFDTKSQSRVLLTTNTTLEHITKDPKTLGGHLSKIARRFQGKSLALMTSLELLQQTARETQRKLHNPYIQVLSQSLHGSKETLIEKFKSASFPSLLMGVDSFWEGMDIKGSALSCVVIVKLPFPVPTEPLHMARIHDIEANGGNGFMDYSLPLALLKFKQGIGRLIRSKSDHGVIIVLDPRIHTKPYGKKFKKALDTHTILEGPLGTILDESVAWYDNEKQRSKT